MGRTRMVVVGGVAAGMSGASKARRTDPGLDIEVFERSAFVSYGSCGLPYFIAGEIPRLEDLIVRTPEEFSRQGIAVHVEHEVEDLDLQRRRLRVRDRRTGTIREVAWDRLLLTTGGRPVRPALPGADLAGVFTLRTPEDGQAILRWVADRSARRAVVVGGGYIGLEMAEAFRVRGLEVELVELLPQVLPNVDRDMTEEVLRVLGEHGVGVHLETGVEGFQGKERVESVVAGGRQWPCDIALLAVGIRPAVDLARAAGLRLGPTGAVAVDDHQRTSAADVWAAGDVAEARHLVTGKPTWVPLGTTANKQGRVAGENMAGGDARFEGIVGTALIKVFDLQVGRTGLTEREAAAAGFAARAVTITAGSRAHYMPGHQPIRVKLVYEAATGRLLGGQMVGREGVAHRIDVLAAALHGGWTVDELGRLDLSYHPSFAPVWDPILIAAGAARRG